MGKMSLQSLQSRYRASTKRLKAQFINDVGNLSIAHEVASLAKRFNLTQKKRTGSDYADLADFLLSNYPSVVAYFITVELNEQFEQMLGYSPIGQIMVAMEIEANEKAANWIACGMRNFPRVETARLAFGIIKSNSMRSLVRVALAADDSELADYITSGEIMESHAKAKYSMAGSTINKQPDHKTKLSDGIERMPRELSEAERKGDRLFLHLQVLSFMFLVFIPVIGGLLIGWPGAALGLLVGLLVRVWIRHSMGLRGSNPHDGFFTRMKERANRASPGILESLIERVRQRTFTQEQCMAITKVWDDAKSRIEAATSVEEKRELMNACDVEIKRLSYRLDV
jgi:hypothetical protein